MRRAISKTEFVKFEVEGAQVPGSACAKMLKGYMPASLQGEDGSARAEEPAPAPKAPEKEEVPGCVGPLPDLRKRLRSPGHRSPGYADGWPGQQVGLGEGPIPVLNLVSQNKACFVLLYSGTAFAAQGFGFIMPAGKEEGGEVGKGHRRVRIRLTILQGEFVVWATRQASSFTESSSWAALRRTQ